MPEQFKQEKRENKPKVELKIIEPRGDKNFMIAFEGETEEICMAYNIGIRVTLEEVELQPFHQIKPTTGGNNDPGFHAWEIWQKLTKDEIESLFVKIEENAQKYL